MGLKFRSNQVGPWYTKVNVPVDQGLEGWFTFDTDAKRFFFNRAKGKADALIVGAPVAYPTHGRFKGLVNYLKTSIRETDGQTLIVVGKAAAQIPADASTSGDASSPFYVGNYRGTSVTEGVSGTAYGSSLYHVAASSLTASSCRMNGSGGATSSVRSVGGGEVATDWGIRVMRASSSYALKVQNLTRNTVAVGSDLNARVLSDSVFQIGSGTMAFGGEVDISAVAIYSRVLTDTELNEVATAMRKRMLRLGINV